MEKPKYNVTDADKKYNTDAWKRYQDGNPNYYHVPLKKAKFQRDPKTSANA